MVLTACSAIENLRQLWTNYNISSSILWMHCVHKAKRNPLITSKNEQTLFHVTKTHTMTRVLQREKMSPLTKIKGDDLVRKCLLLKRCAVNTWMMSKKNLESSWSKNILTHTKYIVTHYTQKIWKNVSIYKITTHNHTILATVQKAVLEYTEW